MITKHITLRRGTNTHEVSKSKLNTQVEHIVNRALGGNRGRNWNCQRSDYNIEVPFIDIQLKFSKISGHKSPAVVEKQWQQIVKYVTKAGNSKRMGEFAWGISDGDSTALAMVEVATARTEQQTEQREGPVRSYCDKLNLEPGDVYNGIYDRDDQIMILHSAIKAAIDSDFQNRFNVVLHGPAGCGKTEILRRTGKMLGKENEAYMNLDATSTTAAGASALLLNSTVVPPVLFIEEVEKTDEASLRWLLGVLDQRGEIRRTNFRIGNRARNVKMLAVATVNDMSLFERVMSGALASRFPNKLYCPRPNRAVVAKILEREIHKLPNNSGKLEWIEPALRLCMDDLKWTDPRAIIPVCLCGRDKLLTGEYQRAVKNTHRADG